MTKKLLECAAEVRGESLNIYLGQFVPKIHDRIFYD